MKKKTAAILITILSCCSSLNVQAKYMDVDTYSICKNDIFIDVENMNVKKIVTDVCDNGKFFAKDLADWMKEHDFYKITEIKSNGETHLLYYEFDMDKEDETNEIADIDFGNLIFENDIIKFSDTTMERVVSNAGGGNFFTEVSNNNFFDDVDFSSMKDQIILHQDIIDGDVVEDSIPLDDNAPLDVQNP
ncbi:hypothetical protein NXH76_20130 [Blautia schinkii]|nr:hypothetical protein [Blautia schinkii]